ncbi:hypothetical protein EV363DRAFT_1178419 [Boletus edulis]|uniref:Uncharacterized protein n=1 Tax=Boletus edulis BED1 TaxID=1328754 RepID=A0AAD4BGL1_BOLED|nr:hypothetical protein EV363DRAFT_1178419 [Boletus edulis]KAF8427179.1 hypothetical protein L210DRAFT_3176793 [Boletus edulis BED1]KAF8433698.1 hypothetical protein L210DRAFT_2695166 [Boletus edulis BED1]
MKARGSVESLVVSNDGQWLLVSGDDDRKAIVWNPRSPEKVLEVTEHKHFVYQLRRTRWCRAGLPPKSYGFHRSCRRAAVKLREDALEMRMRYSTIISVLHRRISPPSFPPKIYPLVVNATADISFDLHFLSL